MYFTSITISVNFPYSVSHITLNMSRLLFWVSIILLIEVQTVSNNYNLHYSTTALALRTIHTIRSQYTMAKYSYTSHCPYFLVYPSASPYLVKVYCPSSCKCCFSSSSRKSASLSAAMRACCSAITRNSWACFARASATACVSIGADITGIEMEMIHMRTKD